MCGVSTTVVVLVRSACTTASAAGAAAQNAGRTADRVPDAVEPGAAACSIGSQMKPTSAASNRDARGDRDAAP